MNFDYRRHRQWQLPRAQCGPGFLALIGLSVLLLATGCSHLKLQRNTIGQGSTLTDIQYQQVLDNLAMFACNSDSLAWHIKINGGVVQVADQGSGFLGTNLGGPGIFAPNFGIQRNVLNQWNVDPVIESDDLELLQLAYCKAINPADMDGSIKREIYEKIGDLCANFHIVLTRQLAFDMIETKKLHASAAEQPRLDRLHRELEKLYVQIDALSEKAQEYDPDKMFARGAEVPTKLEFLKEEAVRLTSEVTHGAVEPVRAFRRPGRNVGLVEQAQDKIEALVKLVEELDEGAPSPFSMPWISQGCRGDIPPCACLVGHYRGCGSECYVWIRPEQMKQFRDFILIVLSLAPPSSQDSASTPVGIGAANSPSF